MNLYTPLVAPRTIDEIFSDRRYVSQAQIAPERRHSRDPYNLGHGWYHLSVPENCERFGLMASGHINGVWNTTYAQLNAELESIVKQAIFWPPSGFEVINLIDGRSWVVATGNGMIGGCAICFLEE